MRHFTFSGMDYGEPSQGQRGKARKTKYETIEVQDSQGQTHTITVPASYVPHIPKRWEWNEQRQLACELVASGMAVKEVAEQVGVAVNTVHGWRHHPEFQERVNELVMESGLASKRTRIAKLNAIANRMFDKIIQNLDAVEIDSRNIVQFIAGFRELAKHIAQERQEFVELAKVEQKTELSGSVSTTNVSVSMSLEEFLAALNKEEREQAKREIRKIADAYIDHLNGVPLTALSLEDESEKMREEFAKVADQYIPQLRGDAPINDIAG